MDFDQKALSQLYERYHAVVYQRCLWLLQDEEEAKDALQEVFVRVIRCLPQLRQEKPSYSWIYRIATNYCLTQLRNKGLRQALLRRMVEPVLKELDSFNVDIEHPHFWDKLAGSLDPETQELAVMCYVCGMTQKEMETVTGLSRKAIRNKLEKFVRLARKLSNSHLTFAQAGA